VTERWRSGKPNKNPEQTGLKKEFGFVPVQEEAFDREAGIT